MITLLYTSTAMQIAMISSRDWFFSLELAFAAAAVLQSYLGLHFWKLEIEARIPQIAITSYFDVVFIYIDFCAKR